MIDLQSLLIVTVVLTALLITRIPVAFSLIVSGAVGIYMVQGEGAVTSVLARMPYDTTASYTMIIIPLFIALGVMASRGRLARDGFAAAAKFTGKLSGGLGIASVAACAAFAAVSGSSSATVVALGPTAVKEMIRHGYDKTVAAGIVGAAGTLGVLIPPSVALILFGILTRESISALLLAGIIPGLLSAIFFAAAVFLRAKFQPHLFGRGGTEANTVHTDSLIAVGAEPTTSDSNRDTSHGVPGAGSEDAAAAALPDVPEPGSDFKIWSLFRLGILFSVIMGGIYLGIATVTEAAALGALLGLIFYGMDLLDLPRGRRLSEARETLAESVRLSSMTMALLIGGAVFSYFLVIAGVPNAFGQWVVGLQAPAVVIVGVIILGYLILGMFIDGLSILLIAVPLTYPVMIDLGYDGIWIGIAVIKAIEIGLITPPFGLNAYMVAGTVPGLTVKEAFRGVVWFLPVEILLLVLIISVPGLATWLPTMAGY